jgi:hypothetical protein
MSSADSPSSDGEENRDPMFNVVAGLLKQIKKVAVVNGPSVALVDDLVAVVHKHDVKSEVTKLKVEKVTDR